MDKTERRTIFRIMDNKNNNELRYDEFLYIFLTESVPQTIIWVGAMGIILGWFIPEPDWLAKIQSQTVWQIYLGAAGSIILYPYYVILKDYVINIYRRYQMFRKIPVTARDCKRLGIHNSIDYCLYMGESIDIGRFMCPIYKTYGEDQKTTLQKLESAEMHPLTNTTFEDLFGHMPGLIKEVVDENNWYLCALSETAAVKKIALGKVTSEMVNELAVGMKDKINITLTVKEQ